MHLARRHPCPTRTSPPATGACTLAELYPDGRLPTDVLNLLRDKAWCDGTRQWAALAAPARVTLPPGTRLAAMETRSR